MLGYLGETEKDILDTVEHLKSGTARSLHNHTFLSDSQEPIFMKM